MLVEIKRLNFEHYQKIILTESDPVKGGANPGIDQGNLRSWQGPNYVQNFAFPQLQEGTG